MMNNSGQSCNAPSRLLVERGLRPDGGDCRGSCRGIKVGPASEPGKHIGPVVNKRQWDQIQGYIQKGIDEGARLVAAAPACPRASTAASTSSPRSLPM
jgi:aldehyde dehydrogenase (NAD+)